VQQRIHGGATFPTARREAPRTEAAEDRCPRCSPVAPDVPYRRWIDKAADVTDLLQPMTTSLVTVPVSSYVNSPKNDGPQAIERVEPSAPPQGALF
jgi:hypothetical protein